MSSTYTSILALEKLYGTHSIQIHVAKDDFLSKNESYPAVEFRLNDQSFNLYVDDEYHDLKFGNPLLDFALCYESWKPMRMEAII